MFFGLVVVQTTVTENKIFARTQQVPAVTGERRYEKIVVTGRDLEGKEKTDGSSRAPGKPRDSGHGKQLRQRHTTMSRDRSRDGGSVCCFDEVHEETHTYTTSTIESEGGQRRYTMPGSDHDRMNNRVCERNRTSAKFRH